MRHETTNAAFFESMYQQNPDPWNFETSPYEQQRYNAIIDALDKHRYARAFEPGCSVGVLTQALARYCDHLDAIDISATAIAHARQRCKDLPNVHLQCGSLPDAMPREPIDLVVFSEIGYYFERRELIEIIHRLADGLNPGGTFLAVHWLGSSPDHLLSGDEVHQTLRECGVFVLDMEQRHPSFRLDRMVRP